MMFSTIIMSSFKDKNSILCYEWTFEIFIGAIFMGILFIKIVK